jgi:hypothetical protein
MNGVPKQNYTDTMKYLCFTYNNNCSIPESCICLVLRHRQQEED